MQNNVKKIGLMQVLRERDGARDRETERERMGERERGSERERGRERERERPREVETNRDRAECEGERVSTLSSLITGGLSSTLSAFLSPGLMIR